MAEIKEKERKNNNEKQERKEYTGYLNCCFKYEKSVKAKVLSFFGGRGGCVVSGSHCTAVGG